MSGLSFDALPSINIPFRYFLISPIFVIFTALFIMYSGPDVWFSRWHPSMFAITHGFTLGFITTVMMGALFQIFPVACGTGFPKVNLVADFSFVLHSLGTFCLMLNFAWPDPIIKTLSIIFLICGFGIYICAVIWTLMKKLSQGVVILGIRLGVIAFVIVILLGVSLQLGVFYGDKNITNLHVLWGGFGWIGLLIMAVSFQIIPMFHVAPDFPRVISKSIPFLIIILLLLASFLRDTPTHLITFLLMINSIYSISVLYVVSKRKRKIPDVTIQYWQLASIAILILFFLFCFGKYFLPDDIMKKQTLLGGAIFIYFYLVSIIQGMLLKIIPFLSYTHLQQRSLMNFEVMALLPNMHDFINKKQAAFLFKLHMTTGVCLVFTILYPYVSWLFGCLLLMEFSGLLFLMLKAVSLYKSSSDKINHLLVNPS
ncbi:hypothetical protein SAMN02745724_04088 [Pseudoalteromonas denitrificans DSM 6059]|uniref:Uncharacterized protein n=2 Tax=Pseudoalteromonas TaxID=53246 RepID=A0A1I1RAW0_9GAMM|nr:hypothetical protein SAMN02745724_04088 [Pseudoalteromonas denitrificans DSM 6059]